MRRKVEGMLELGARLLFEQGGDGEAEARALGMRGDSDMVWVSPYNEFDVVEGRGTLALEIIEEVGDAEAVDLFIPVSGGGLACGIRLAVRERRPDWRPIGVQTAAAPYLAAHFAGRDMDAVTELETIADGLAGPVQDDSATLEWLARAVVGVELVQEDEIRAAMRWVHPRTREKIEPSGAAAAAAFRRRSRSRLAVAIMSGGNVDPEFLQRAPAETDHCG